MSALGHKRIYAVQQIPALAMIRLASRWAKARIMATAVARAKPACAQQGVILCAHACDNCNLIATVRHSISVCSSNGLLR
jgi:hypothetical protein